MTALDRLIEAIGLDPIPGASLISHKRGAPEDIDAGIRWMIYADAGLSDWRAGFWCAETGETPHRLPGEMPRFVVSDLPSPYIDNDLDRPRSTEDAAAFLLRQLAEPGALDVHPVVLDARFCRLVDWQVREWLPIFLAAVPSLAGYAAAIRALPPLDSDEALRQSSKIRCDALSAASNLAWTAAVWPPEFDAADLVASAHGWHVVRILRDVNDNRPVGAPRVPLGGLLDAAQDARSMAIAAIKVLSPADRTLVLARARALTPPPFSDTP